MQNLRQQRNSSQPGPKARDHVHPFFPPEGARFIATLAVMREIRPIVNTSTAALSRHTIGNELKNGARREKVTPLNPPCVVAGGKPEREALRQGGCHRGEAEMRSIEAGG
jgi:hypothetical protein